MWREGIMGTNLSRIKITKRWADRRTNKWIILCSSLRIFFVRFFKSNVKGLYMVAYVEPKIPIYIAIDLSAVQVKSKVWLLLLKSFWLHEYIIQRYFTPIIECNEYKSKPKEVEFQVPRMINKIETILLVFLCVYPGCKQVLLMIDQPVYLHNFLMVPNIL